MPVEDCRAVFNLVSRPFSTNKESHFMQYYAIYYTWAKQTLGHAASSLSEMEGLKTERKSGTGLYPAVEYYGLIRMRKNTFLLIW